MICQRPDDNIKEKKGFSYLSETIKSLEEYGGKIMVLDVTPDNISSSCIRNFIGKRKDPLDRLDKEVYEYAKKNNLYSD